MTQPGPRELKKVAAYTLENAPDEVHEELMAGLDAIIAEDDDSGHLGKSGDMAI